MKICLTDIPKNFITYKFFFYLSTVLSGISLAGFQPEGTLTDFIDPRGNHRWYKLKLHVTPSLPFLYPFIINLKRGNHSALKAVFSFLLYDQYLQCIVGQIIIYIQKHKTSGGILRIQIKESNLTAQLLLISAVLYLRTITYRLVIITNRFYYRYNHLICKLSTNFLSLIL